ncbi:hypothetical protein ABZ590_22190, partial [Streptomyces hirsutus]
MTDTDRPSPGSFAGPGPGLTAAWSSLGGDPALLARVTTVERSEALPARLPVREVARACVGACALAAAELGARRAGPA